MKKAMAILLVMILMLSGCAKIPSEATNQTEQQSEPETTMEIVPEAAVSVPVIYLRVAYATEDGFVGLTVPEPGDRMQEGKEINIVIEDGVEICVPIDERSGKYVNAKEVAYTPGMLVEVQYTKWNGDTIYPELMYQLDALWWVCCLWQPESPSAVTALCG